MKNYLITGATSALGTELSKIIAAQANPNTKLLMLSRTHSSDLEHLTNSSIRYISGVDLITLHTDDKYANLCSEFFDGSISLIHCAGDFWAHRGFLDVSTELAEKYMNSHYLTLYAVLQSVLPIMIKKNGGKIAAFSFNSSNENFPHILPFNAAKAAVEATIKCIAHEYAKENIVANILSLASLKTEASRKSRPFGDFENYLELSELCNAILEAMDLSPLINASTINIYKYSDSYYNQGYFERIKHL